MTCSTPSQHRARRTAHASWRSEHGAFDLPSILIGVLVVGILTAGVLAAVFGVIPWSQDEQAKGNLSAVRTAEGTHVAKDKGFVDLAGLQAAKYLPTTAERLTVSADPAGACYMAVAKSQSGKVFYSTDKSNDAREMTPATTAGPGSTVVPCLPAAAVQDLVDDTGGYEPDVFKPIGDGDGTSTDPGVPTRTTADFDEPVTANKDVTTGDVTVTDRTVEVSFQNTSSSPTTARYAGRVTCYDPSRNSTTVEDIDGYFDLNSNIYADMTLVICSPGTQPVDVEFRPFDATYTGTGTGGKISGAYYHWRAPVQYTQATWVTRGLTASYDGQWCIENKNNAATDGNPIFLAPCAKVDAQRWQWNGDGEIRQSKLDHKCAAAAADKLILSACATPGQQFKAEAFQGENKTGGLVQIVHTASGKCVDIPGGTLASVQLGLATCNGNSTQSWYMPGLAGSLKPELQQPEIIDPEPLTPVADANAANLAIVPSAGGGWGTWFTDRTVTSMTTPTARIAFGVNNAKPSSNYTVEWSGAALNATAMKVPATTNVAPFGTQLTWYGDVTAAAGGYKTGTGYVTAKITDKSTGLSSVKSWKITVNEAAIVSPTALQGWSTSYWPDRATTEKTSGGMMFAFGINNAKTGDFTVTWSGGSAINASAGATSFSDQGSQGLFYSTVTPGAGGYRTGTDTLTATVRHNASGTVLTKTWTMTVNPLAVVSPTALQGWSSAYWPDRTTTELTGGSMMFAFGINNAKTGDFTVTWSGGSAINATAGATTFTDQGSQGIFYSTVTPGAGGYGTGTDTLTATVRHNASGTEITKTWNMTVNTVAIVAPSSLQGWSSAYWPDRTVTVGSAANTMFAFAIPNAKASDFTITWSGGSEVNSAPLAGSYTDQGSQGVYYANIKPGTGGYTAGTSTITATATHAPSGRVLTKTWTLTAK